MEEEIPESIVGPYVIEDILSYASHTPSGCFVEVGVYKGGSAWHLSNLAESQYRSIFLYDTFSGIPFQGKTDSHKVGDFADTSFEEVKKAIPYANVVKGIFPQSAIQMPPIAFVHLDCDQRDSILNAVRYLRPKMVSGGIIWFDDTTLLHGAKDALLTLIIEDEIPRPKLSKTNRHYVVF